ncbi:MAG: hypothetical protein K2N51_15445 [Lachnospiraceae bacterium]|nr:hypothetical protein [Lachnospiraceae bacterium]
MMIFLGIVLVLTYGQIQKPEGCASFETIFAQFEANKLCNYFIDGDMDKLTAYIHIFPPTDGYQKDWENDLRNQVADSLTSILCQKKGADYSVLSKYFHKDANRNSKKDTLGKDFVTKLTALLSNQIILTDAVFTPYEYNSKTKKLSTCLMLRFENSRTNSSGILYQPFIVGLYGYAPTDMPKFYSEYMEETITSQIRNLFSISNP